MNLKLNITEKTYGNNPKLRLGKNFSKSKWDVRLNVIKNVFSILGLVGTNNDFGSVFLHRRCRLSSSCDEIIWELLTCFPKIRGHLCELTSLKSTISPILTDLSPLRRKCDSRRSKWLRGGWRRDVFIEMKRPKKHPRVWRKHNRPPLWDVRNKQEIKSSTGYCFSELSEP